MGTCHPACRQLSGSLAITVLAAVCFPMACNAAQWSSPTNGSFQDSGRWSPTGVPGTSDTAYFVHAGTYSVDFTGDATTDRIDITAGDVTFNLNSQTYSALKSTLFSPLPGSLHVTGPDGPSLTVTGGTLEIQSATLGHAFGSTGDLIVDGAGAALIAEEVLLLGQGGEGWVTLQGGAQGQVPIAYVGITGSAGVGSVLQVLDEGSYLTIAEELHVASSGGKGLAGAGGGGTLDVAELVLAPRANSIGIVTALNDSHVIVRGDALLGRAAGNDGGHATLNAVGGGTIAIHGALQYDHRSQFILNGNLDVGSMTRVNDLPHQGQFILWQGGGLRVRNDVTTFDLGFGSLDQDVHVQIDGDLHFDERRTFLLHVHSAIVSAGSLSGNGDFTFTSGTLNLGELELGTASTMRQSLVVQGAHPSVTKFNNAGTTDVQQGGELRLSGSTATFGGIVANSGSLKINQSQVAFNGTGDFGFKGLVSLGSLSIANSTIAGTVATGPGSGFEVSGEVTFNGPVKTQVDITHPAGAEQPRLNFQNELHVGGVASQTLDITIDGNVTLGPDSRLVLEVGGTDPGEYDTLDVQGIMTLGGTLEVSFLSSYTPSVGDHFQLITADRQMGSFGDLALPTLPGGLKFDMWRIQGGELVVLSGLDGDYNNDGAVDAADYVVWRNSFGSLLALYNDTSAGVGTDDYERWKSAYGQSMPEAVAVAAQVPEPKGIAAVLLLVGVVARKKPGCRK